MGKHRPHHSNTTWPTFKEDVIVVPAPHKRGLLGLIPRVYAIIPIVLVSFLSYKALEYLVVSLVFPTAAPTQITEIPTRLTRDTWNTRRDLWTGLEIAETPRTPLAHYHRITGWFQPDQFNNCTTSGCHNPMAHSRNKALRAFLNMHATSVHCGVCHMDTKQDPLPLVWYDLDNGHATDTPALLRAYAWLLSPEGQEAIANPSAETQAHLVSLLREAAEAADNPPSLVNLANELYAVRYTSDRYQSTAATVAERLAPHFRGEYGAKLALRDANTGQPILAHPETQDVVDELLTSGVGVGTTDWSTLVVKVHSNRRSTPLHCTQCHQATDSLVDLSTVGYPQQRIRALHEPWIFRAIEHIAEGQPLYLPGFVVPETQETPSSSAPSEG